MKWDQQALEAWFKESTQNDEDVIDIQRQDEAQIQLSDQMNIFISLSYKREFLSLKRVDV